jgi:hypothetical protein
LLIGSQIPFDIESIHSNWGNVSHDAGIEVEGRFYAWDQTKGPYWTDLQNWVSLVDGRIKNLIDTVNLIDGDDIRVEHDERNSLIVWAVPTDGNPRKRTLLAYHYGLDAWLPPMMGLEYGTLRTYLSNDGVLRLMLGDYQGRLWSLFDGHRDAPASGTVTGTVNFTDGSYTSLWDSTAAFFTTGSGLVGCTIAVQNQTTGTWQWRRIGANTSGSIFLDTTYGRPWDAVPRIGDRYIVGGIDWWLLSPWMDGGAPLIRKRAAWLELQSKPGDDETAIQIVLRFDDNAGVVGNREATLTAETAAALWDQAQWGTAVWSATARRARKFRIGRTFQSVQMMLGNSDPDRPVTITGFAIGADPLSRAVVPGGGA